MVRDINANSALYLALGGYDYHDSTRLTAAPGEAVVLVAVAQPEESVPHRMYGTYATGSPRLVNFEDSPMDYSQGGHAAMPTVDPLDQTGFGWGTTLSMQDALVVSVVQGRQTFTSRNGTPTAPELWQRLTGGNDGLNTVTGLGSTAISEVVHLVTIDLAAAGAGAASADLPSITRVPRATPIYVRRKDANGAATAALTPAVGETINGGASLPVAITSAVVIMHDDTEWYSFP
jgi:hypothetical protein